MSHNAYYEIYLHIVWHTKGGARVLRGPIESAVHEFLRRRIMGADGTFIDAVGGTDDHIHIAAHLAPTIEIAKWIGELKGACSHYINSEIAKEKLLYWQNGYGVVSFGKKNLQFVIDYINNQRCHHADRGVIERLEWCSAEPWVNPSNENPA